MAEKQLKENWMAREGHNAPVEVIYYPSLEKLRVRGSIDLVPSAGWVFVAKIDEGLTLCQACWNMVHLVGGKCPKCHRRWGE